ncbi:MAG: hypothetical protein LUO99_01855 [Methanomicrobiales archaeon]|nr:hypothetical protein [Methanomicrobiales archaeon]
MSMTGIIFIFIYSSLSGDPTGYHIVSSMELTFDVALVILLIGLILTFFITPKLEE